MSLGTIAVLCGPEYEDLEVWYPKLRLEEAGYDAPLVGMGDAKYSGSPTEPFFFLALGNDGRSNADKGLGDAIHVIGVNPAAQQATIINVPRDTTAPGGDKPCVFATTFLTSAN